MTDTGRLIEIEAQDAGLTLDEDILADLNHYVVTLERWGKRMNLTANPTAAETIRKHMPDAFWLVQHLNQLDQLKIVSHADFGSGAGLPGLLLALLRPDLTSTLVESNGKKCSFMRTVIHELGRSDIVIVNKRMSTCGVGDMDLVTSRATWAPEQWLERAATVCRIDGLAVAFSIEPLAVDGCFWGFQVHSQINYVLDDGTERVQTFLQLRDTVL